MIRNPKRNGETARSAFQNRSRKVVGYLEKPVLAAALLTIADCLGLLLGTGSIRNSTLVLVLFSEGGLGLLAGVGIALSATPSVAKVGETFFQAAPWSREGEKHAEKAAWRWMAASGFLILIGFAVSLV
jgi:hypothetical protein